MNLKATLLKNWFSAYMFLAVAITAIMIVKNNNEILEFKNNSVDQILTLEITEPEDVESIRRRLQRATYQPVYVESLGENKYKIWLKCPPDKCDQLLGRLYKSKKKEANDN